MSAPLVSVVVPTYNRASFIQRAIDSVLSQDHGNLELLIVDEGSKDQTVDIVAANRDPRLRLIRRDKPSGGAATPRNIGIRESRGEYIAFLDSDDEFLPGRISRQLAAFESARPDTQLMFTNYSEIGVKTRPHIAPQVPSGYLDTSHFPASLFCTPSSWMIHRRAVGKVGFFDENIRMVEDADYVARAVRAGSVYYLNEILANIHVHSNPVGRSPVSYSEGTADYFLGKWSDEILKDKTYATDFFCKMTKDLLRAGNPPRARAYARRALAWNPLSLRVWRMALKAYQAPLQQKA